MSSFQHTVQSIQRTRMILVASAALAALVVTIALIVSGSSTSTLSRSDAATSHPSQSELQSQLRAAAGPHYQAPRQAR